MLTESGKRTLILVGVGVIIWKLFQLVDEFKRKAREIATEHEDTGREHDRKSNPRPSPQNLHTVPKASGY